ncbi:MAG: hypothetical protein IKN31_05065 [Bacteroidales bacterium]|nr:hypothetical protein [Bacteroidales bacterium]
MKKILLSLLLVLPLCSCIRSQESSPAREVWIENISSYDLVFTEIDNGGDTRFWPQTSFTLKPYEEYRQSYNLTDRYQSFVLIPLSMTIECNGKSIHFTRESGYEKNPCILEHYYKLDNFSVYGPGIHFRFNISDEDLQKWFGADF